MEKFQEIPEDIQKYILKFVGYPKYGYIKELKEMIGDYNIKPFFNINFHHEIDGEYPVEHEDEERHAYFSHITYEDDELFITYKINYKKFHIWFLDRLIALNINLL